MVKENSYWTRVKDSKHGIAIGPSDVEDGTYVVYTFACENRRILINKTLFTDYFEVIEQTGLQKLGEKYFDQYREHADQLNQIVVDLNNKK